jgi:regulator of replication initiation timing
MRKEWILTEEEKFNKKRRIEENRRLRLSNTNEIKEVINSNEKLDLDLQSVVLDKNKISSINTKSSSIQNHDIVNNVVAAFNDGFKLDPTSYGWSYPLAKKITALCQILNTKNTTALRLISFYKRLSQFDSLNEIDKVNLIKNNLSYIFIFHASLG